MTYPDRIPYQAWINSQLSVARFYGGMTLNGKDYWIEKGTNDLVHAPKKKSGRKKPTKTEKRFYEWYQELQLQKQ